MSDGREPACGGAGDRSFRRQPLLSGLLTAAESAAADTIYQEVLVECDRGSM